MRRILITLLAGGLFVIGVPVVAAAGTSPSVPAAPATAPPGVPSAIPPASPDALAAQLQAQLQQQAALAATVATLGMAMQAARDSQSSLRDLVMANQQSITQTLTQLTAAEQRYSDAANRQASAHATAVDARARELRDKQLLAMYVRSGYERSDGVLAYVLSSSSFSDLMGRAADLQRLTTRSTSLVSRIAADISAAESAEAAAAAQATTAQQAAAQLQAQEQTLQQQTDHASQLIGQLGVQVQATSAEITAANTQSLAVAQQVADTRIAELDNSIAQAEQAAWQAAEYYVQNHLGTLPSSIAMPPATPVNPDGSQLIWPVHGASVTQHFGPSAYPFEPAFGGYPHFHTGVDIGGPMGTPVMAAADAVVVAAAASTVGYGNHIILASAGGVLTLYGHLAAMLVHPGDTLKVGQVIGLMGSTGNSTGSHLHFEVRVNNQPLDPTRFLPALPAEATAP